MTPEARVSVAGDCIIHRFWLESDPQMQLLEMTNFMKNTGLTGAVLITLVALSTNAIGLTITGPLFDLS